MKRMLSMLMILALLLCSVSAFAQDKVLGAEEMEIAESAESLEGEEEMLEIFDIHGEIIEITDEYVLIDTADMGHVQVNLSEDTVIEGVEELKVGQTAVVMYNGMMTRSLPPQITALHIGVYMVSGVITEVMEDSIVIVQDETGEEIILTLPISEDLGENEEYLEDEALAEELENEEISDELLTEDEEVFEEAALGEETLEEEQMEDGESAFEVGDVIVAYTNGAMTMSLPPQMNALAIVFADIATPDEAQGALEFTEETEEIEEIDETVG